MLIKLSADVGSDLVGKQLIVPNTQSAQQFFFCVTYTHTREIHIILNFFYYCTPPCTDSFQVPRRSDHIHHGTVVVKSFLKIQQIACETIDGLFYRVHYYCYVEETRIIQFSIVGIFNWIALQKPRNHKRIHYKINKVYIQSSFVSIFNICIILIYFTKYKENNCNVYTVIVIYYKRHSLT